MHFPPLFRLLPLLFPLLLLSLANTGCQPARESETGLYVVLARLSDPDGPRIRPPLKLGRVVVGRESRLAVRVTPNSSFELEIDSRVRRLLYAPAVRGAAVGTKHAFSIEQQNRGSWERLWSEEFEGGVSEWRDRRIDLAETSEAKRRLRFNIGASEPGDAELFWGSIAFVAPENALEESDAEHLTAPPNIILLSLDTLGAGYLNFSGQGPNPSPAIDSFLDTSFAFRRAYVQYPNTLVSHASLFTALYPLHHGVYPGTRQPLRSLVKNLAHYGYLTAAFSENGYVSSGFGFAEGFDRYSDGRTLERFAGDADKTFADATTWLAEHGNDTRFFLFVHTYEVHAPYIPRDKEALEVAERITPGDDRILDEVLLMRHNYEIRTLKEADLDRLRALYVAEIQYLDRAVRGFLRELTALGIAQNTLVILTSDHGEQFGEGGKVGHGHNLHNLVLHVPLGFRWPGRLQNSESQDPVQLIDVMPTVFELAGIPVPDGLDGQSLAAAMLGTDPDPAERPVFSELISSANECFLHTGNRSCRLGRFAVQTRRFKLVTSEIPRRKRFYDLAADPAETRDVSHRFPKERAQHQALLTEYLESSESQPHTTDHDSPGLDAELRERLKALGYVE